MPSEYKVFKNSSKVELRINKFWWKFGAALTTFVALSLLVMFSSTANEVSTSLFRLINQKLPETLMEPLLILMEVGNTWSITFIIISFFALKRWVLAYGALFTSLISAALSRYVIKPIATFERPFLALDNVILRTDVDIEALQLVYQTSGFPSGHTSGFTIITVMLWPYVTKPVKVLLIFLLFSVAIGRIYSGVHFPIDVLGGLAFGATLGLAARQISYLLIPKLKNK